MSARQSFRQFDYRVRPAKQVERRMLGETFNLLNKIEDIKNYRYIGFGSMAFQDFILMHRSLGLKDMISIERDAHFDRANFNKPYHCIDIKAGDSTSVLQKLAWNQKSIVWLDYDGGIRKEVVDDVGHCGAELEPGSILLVTVNCDHGNKDYKAAAAELKEEIAHDLLPNGFEPRNMSPKLYPELLRYVLDQQLRSAANKRNSCTAEEQLLSINQFIYFTYKDGAKMCTLGWLIDKKESLFRNCDFEKLDWYSAEQDPYEIKVPVLTPVEIRHLNSQLPSDSITDINSPGVAPSDIESYSKIYRLMPLYAEVWQG